MKSIDYKIYSILFSLSQFWLFMVHKQETGIHSQFSWWVQSTPSYYFCMKSWVVSILLLHLHSLPIWKLTPPIIIVPYNLINSEQILSNPLNSFLWYHNNCQTATKRTKRTATKRTRFKEPFIPRNASCCEDLSMCKDLHSLQIIRWHHRVGVKMKWHFLSMVLFLLGMQTLNTFPAVTRQMMLTTPMLQMWQCKSMQLSFQKLLIWGHPMNISFLHLKCIVFNSCWKMWFWILCWRNPLQILSWQ